MTFANLILTLWAMAAILPLLDAMYFSHAARTTPAMQSPSINSGEATAVKMCRAVSRISR
jgi:hypothetical protein